MAVAVLYPRFDHPAIEERYASWQTQMLLRGPDHRAHLIFYEPDELASDVVGGVDEEHVLVVTDPPLLPSTHLATRLLNVLETSGAAAAVPVANEANHDRQRSSPPAPYLTLREAQEAIESLAQQPATSELVTWDHADP